MPKKNKTFGNNKLDSIKKNVVKTEVNSENMPIAWRFHHIDRDGEFAFNPVRDDFNNEFMFQKILEFSGMKWSQIRKATHDNNKSKHHFLEYDALSKKAKARFDKLELSEHADQFFSIAFNNRIRVIGIRNDSYFDVLWYDPNHEVCPSNLKHT